MLSAHTKVAPQWKSVFLTVGRRGSPHSDCCPSTQTWEWVVATKPQLCLKVLQTLVWKGTTSGERISITFLLEATSGKRFKTSHPDLSWIWGVCLRVGIRALAFSSHLSFWFDPNDLATFHDDLIHWLVEHVGATINSAEPGSKRRVVKVIDEVTPAHPKNCISATRAELLCQSEP